MTKSNKTISPLRQRLLEDMTIRKLGAKTRQAQQPASQPLPTSRRQPSLPRLPRTGATAREPISQHANRRPPDADSRVYPDCRGMARF